MILSESKSPNKTPKNDKSRYLVILRNSRPLSDSVLSHNSTIRKFALQAQARELVPHMRVSNCLRLPLPHVSEIDILSNGKRATFSNLTICASVWSCPVCSIRISEQRRAELSLALKNWLLDPRNLVFMATFTFSHQINTPLSETLEILKESKRKMKSGRTWQNFAKNFGVVGTITANEVTFGKNGFHPHQHELLFITLPKGVSKRFLTGQLQYLLNGYWLDSLSKMGASGISGIACDVVASNEKIAQYVAKFGQDEIEVRQWNLSHEMTKTVTKRGKKKDSFTMTELLEMAFNGLKQAGELWAEYAMAFKGKQQLIWSRGLKKLLGVTELSDTELATSEPDDMRILGSVSLWDWRAIMQTEGKHGARGRILEVAKLGRQELADYLRKEFSVELMTYE